MKLPGKLHRFANKRAVLIVAGKQDAHIYELHDGEVTIKESFSVPRPQITDNDAHYKARTQNGSVREIRDQTIIADFIKELEKRLKKLKLNDYEEIYVSAPPKSRTPVIENLPTDLRSKITHVMNGNYVNTSPLKILEMIDAEKKEPPIPTAPEAQDILKRFS